MTNGDRTEPVASSPGPTAGSGRDATGGGAEGHESDADPFATLGSETRIRIVDALYEQTGSAVLSDGLAYSDLRDHADVADKGNFNYHLDVLRDRFVEKRDGEYRLTFAGFEVAKALRAGAWSDHERRGPVEVDPASRLVDGDPLYATYEGSLVAVHGADGEPVFRIAVRPTGAAHRDLEDLVDVMGTLLEEGIAKTQQGICPYCHAPPDRSIAAADEGRWRYRFVATCPECGPLFEVPAGAAVVRHPAVISFYWDHGVDVRSRRVWDLEPFGDDAVSNDGGESGRLRVSVELDGESLELTLDGSARVVETARR